MCEEADYAVCGDGAEGLVNVCFLSSVHLGEEGVTLSGVPNCQHYESEGNETDGSECNTLSEVLLYTLSIVYVITNTINVNQNEWRVHT